MPVIPAQLVGIPTIMVQGQTGKKLVRLPFQTISVLGAMQLCGRFNGRITVKTGSGKNVRTYQKITKGGGDGTGKEEGGTNNV